MDADIRDRIRHLYFVERVTLRAIAESLALAPHAVRAALVLPGGQPVRRGPAPIATALAATAPARLAPDVPVAPFRRATGKAR